MRYFTTITNHHCQAKNKLQAEWKAYMGQHANRILDDEAAKFDLVEEVTSTLVALNHKYQKCRPLNIYQNRVSQNRFVIGADQDAQLVFVQENTKHLRPNG